MSLPGCAAIPAPHKERAADRLRDAASASSRWCGRTCARRKIMTREAFENVIVVNSAIGGSTNAPIHFNAIAAPHRRASSTTTTGRRSATTSRCWSNLQPAGRLPGRGVPPRRRRAGGRQRADQGRQDPQARADRQRQDAWARTAQDRPIQDRDVIRPYKKPMKDKAGFLNLKGNLFDSAIMKTERDLRGVPQALPVEPEGPERLRGPRHRVRRAGGLPPAHRRPEAQDRRRLHAVHARRRPGRLSGRRRGGEHAAARLRSSRRASPSCPASATAGSRAPRARRRS